MQHDFLYNIRAKKCFAGGVQTRLSILKLKPFPKFKKDATMTQL
jgi:hypothetical protein